MNTHVYIQIFLTFSMTALAHENAMMSSFAGNISDVMAMASSSKRDINHSGQYNSAYDDQTTGTVHTPQYSQLTAHVNIKILFLCT